MGATADTIFALSSGGLPAGLAVVRVSGPESRFVLETISRIVPHARRASLRTLLAADGSILDRGIVLFFPGPASFSGEDCAEFHVHGGRAVAAALLEHLGTLGLRAAEPGEFTRRAFLNGKLDLTEAEALADLIAAETETQRRLAARNAGGAQRHLYEQWRQVLLRSRALVEAELDFSDEGDVPGAVSARVWREVADLRGAILQHLRGYSRAEMIRDGFQVVILGAPNAGKSSLLNAIANREVAIVTEEAGTTRDLIEVALDLNGMKVVLTDTAGMREDPGRVEAIGIARARERASAADLVLHVEDTSAPLPVNLRDVAAPVLKVGTKVDLTRSGVNGSYDYLVSARTGLGIEGLVEELSTRANQSIRFEGVVPSRSRHVSLLQAGAGHLGEALKDMPLELRAEQLRLASDDLGRILGSVEVEDLLGTIFSEFCIGK